MEHAVDWGMHIGMSDQCSDEVRLPDPAFVAGGWGWVNLCLLKQPRKRGRVVPGTSKATCAKLHQPDFGYSFAAVSPELAAA
jgi:hypothetical protein